MTRRREPVRDGQRHGQLDGIAAVYRAAAERDELDTCLYVRLLVATGAGRGEVCGLQWGDIDWAGCSVVIRRSLVVERGQPVVRPLKRGGGPPRPLALGSGTMQALTELRELTRAAGGSVDDEAFIFADWDRAIDGSIPRRPSTWTSRWRALREAARRAGHSPTSTTSDLFGHVVRIKTRGS